MSSTITNVSSSLQTSSRERPLVSLLVAMRNEENYIQRCLGSLFIQEYPADCLEVFILDGESTDNSWEIVSNLIQHRPGYHLIKNAAIYQAAAWNLGIRISHGEIIGIVSGHVKLAPDYVSQAVETLQRTGADMVGGPVQAINHNRLGEAIAMAVSTPFGVGGARFRYTQREEETDTVFMGLCRRSIYQELGGFDEEMIRNQDDEFSYRLRKNGGIIVCNPAIRSEYYSRSGLQSLWRQYFQYGYYKVRVLQKHPRQMRLRQYIPFIFVLALFGALMLVPFTSIGKGLFGLIFGSYLLANLASSIWVAARQGWQFLVYLPLVFATLHFGYGLGFLFGLIKFSHRWNDRKGKISDFPPNQL